MDETYAPSPCHSTVLESITYLRYLLQDINTIKLFMMRTAVALSVAYKLNRLDRWRKPRGVILRLPQLT